MERCQYVMSEEEQKSFRTQLLDEEQLMTAADKIERTAFRKMWELEGITDIENEIKLNRLQGSRGKKPFYLAVGKRIRQYKQYLASLTGGDAEAEAEVLRERPPHEERPGTPPGNTSILSFVRKKK